MNKKFTFPPTFWNVRLSSSSGISLKEIARSRDVIDLDLGQASKINQTNHSLLLSSIQIGNQGNQLTELTDKFQAIQKKVISLSLGSTAFQLRSCITCISQFGKTFKHISQFLMPGSSLSHHLKVCIFSLTHRTIKCLG